MMHIRRFVPAVLAAMWILATPVAAAEITVEAPDGVTVGEEVVVSAAIENEGEPVAGVQAVLSYSGTVVGQTSWVRVDTAVTDENGEVEFDYVQRSASGERMRVEYIGPDGQETAEFEVTITDGGQQVTSDAGADLPILSVWWLVVVLAIVWTLITVATKQIVNINKAAVEKHLPARVLSRFMVGFVVFTALGMAVVVLTKPQSHANLDPQTPFDRVPTAFVGDDVQYTGLSSSTDAPAAGLTGEELYIQAGCANCHGIGGAGAIAGGAIVGEDGPRSADRLTEKLREPPRGMPAYGEGRLSDDQIASIFDYLQASEEGDADA